MDWYGVGTLSVPELFSWGHGTGSRNKEHHCSISAHMVRRYRSWLCMDWLHLTEHMLQGAFFAWRLIVWNIQRLFSFEFIRVWVHLHGRCALQAPRHHRSQAISCPYSDSFSICL